MEYTRLESEVRALEKRLEVWDASGKHYLGIGQSDGIGCRDETIKLQDARIKALATQLAVAAEMLANAKRYLWLKAHPDTTPNLWRLLAKGGPENSSESFDTMVDRIMVSEAAAFERGKTTAQQRD